MPFIIAWVFRMMAWKLTVIIHYLLSSYATRLLPKADFYLQLNAEPQRPSSKEDGSRNAHTQKNVHLDEQWLTTTMYVSVHFYNGKNHLKYF